MPPRVFHGVPSRAPKNEADKAYAFSRDVSCRGTSPGDACPEDMRVSESCMTRHDVLEGAAAGLVINL